MNIFDFKFLLVFVFFLLLYIRYRIKRRPFYELASKLPGPTTFPIIGDVGNFAFSPDRGIEIAMEIVRRFNGGPVRFWFLHELMVLVIKPCDVECVLSNMKLLKKTWHYKIVGDFMGKGLFTNDDTSSWKLNRRIITPAFHFNILKGFIPIFFEETSVFVKKVVPGKEMDVSRMISLLTLDIICRTAMGIRIHSQSGKEDDFVKGLETLFKISIERLAKPWLLSDIIFSLSSLKREHDKAREAVLNFTENVIKRKKAEMEKITEVEYINPKADGIFLDLMLNEKEMSDVQLRDETITILIGGQDTTMTEITFALLMLALHPEVQQKALDEIDTVFQGDKTRVTTLEDLQYLEYLERVIKETMRLFPSIPMYARVTESEMNFNGYILPKGCYVTVLSYATHRDPESYPEPEKFDPDNFLPERCRGRSPFAFIPFSAGQRNCIGQKYAMIQLKTLLSTMLRHYRICPGGNMKCFDDVEASVSTTLKSKKPVRLVFLPR